METKKLLGMFNELMLRKFAGFGFGMKIVILERGKERYAFLFEDKEELILLLAEFADNEDLRFDWDDVSLISGALRKSRPKDRHKWLTILARKESLGVASYLCRLNNKDLLEEIERVINDKRLLKDVREEILRRICNRRAISPEDNELINRLESIATKMDTINSDSIRVPQSLQKLGREFKRISRKILRRM